MRTVNTQNPRRLRILAIVRKDPGISHQELADCLGMSTTGVHYHLAQLEKEGVINRSHERGRRNDYKPQQHKATAVRKIRNISAEKLTEYAKRGRGKNAFIPRKTKKRSLLQERIEMVVKKALKGKGKTDHDVIRHVNAPLRFTNAHKIG